MVVGVSSLHLGTLYAQVLLKMVWRTPLCNFAHCQVGLSLQGKQAMVVHSDEGLDEISPCGPTHAWIVKDGSIETTVITPEALGVHALHIDDIRGSSPSENAALFRQIASGAHPPFSFSFLLSAATDHMAWCKRTGKDHPVMTYVALNAGAALFIGGLASSLSGGVLLALQTLKSGKVADKLDHYVRLSQQHYHA